MVTRTKLVVACVAFLLLASLGGGSSAQSPTFFPIGMMGPANSSTLSTKFQDVAAGGFNVVYEFKSAQDLAEAENYLRQADAVGLKVIQNLPVCRLFATGTPNCQGYALWSEAQWGTFISTLAQHDNLVAWYLPDEIKNYTAAANLYRWVKKYDPRQRPVYGNPGTFDMQAIDSLGASSDVLWAACYPEYYGMPRSIVTYGMKLDAAAAERTTANQWGAILQFFDSSEYGRTGGYPTAHEIRSDCYQAIIGGAKGLWFFNYEMGRDGGLTGPWNEMTRIANEIVGTGGLANVILTPDVPQSITKAVVSGPTQSPPTEGQIYGSIQTLQKLRAGDGTYLFAVNIATNTVVARFANLPVTTGTVQVLFEGRTIPVVDGSFTDTFAQDDVHIYRLASAPAPARKKFHLPHIFRRGS